MEVLEIARRLIRCDTVSQPPHAQSNKEAVLFAAQFLGDLGFSIELYPYIVNVAEGKRLENLNLVARLGGEKSFLAFSGHLDTVAVDRNAWSVEPWDLTERGDRLLGRGITDMKGFDAIALKVAELIHECNLQRPFAIILTGDEEVGCLGAKNLVRALRTGNKPLPRHIIIGEPTRMVPVNLHKGYAYLFISLKWETKSLRTGSSAHSADPRKAKSVVKYVLPHVLTALREFEEHLERILDLRFDPPYPTTNTGVLSTGDGASKNTIPAACLLELDVRPVPGQEAEEVREALERFVLQHIPEETLEDLRVQVDFRRAPTPPMATPPDSELCQAICNVTHEQLTSTCFNTEGGVFNSAGAQCVIWGPGDIAQAHKSDEWADRGSFSDSTIQAFFEVARRLCFS